MTNQHQISKDIQQMTGFATMMHGKAMTGVNSLEARTLRERMARHRALTDLLKSEQVDGDEEDFEENF